MKSDSITRVIILFGGVYSSLGKGIVISSIGKILSCLGKKVSILKFDPYLNVDPENMSPNQHGEVYVCKDGAQTDLDLGNYERFIGCELTQMSNITSGRIYNEIIKKERDGKYNGKTVQVIPHVVNAINSKIYSIIEKEKPNFLLIEVGGTIGDAESIPFVEAISQFIIEYKKENVLSCLLCPLINLSATSNELKTKPTQHSIRQLRSMGIDPNFLILRTNTKIDENIIEKLHTTSHIDKKNIFISPNLNSIYDLPDILYKQQIHLTILNFFSIKYNKNDDNFEKKWSRYNAKIKKITKVVNIGLMGKYTELHDAYFSVVESLKFAGYENDVKIKILWIKVNDKNFKNLIKKCNGIIVPGGFGDRGIEFMINAIKFIRENDIPIFGICLGMQLMLIEFARNVLKIKGAHSVEFFPKTKNPIIDLIDGKLILGNKKCLVKNETIAKNIYKKKIIFQRHRHRYGLFEKKIMKKFTRSNIDISIISKYDNKNICEFIEDKNKKCYIGCQFHPEFHSKPQNVDPAFLFFVKQSINAIK